jgi:hypothetical protein
MTATDIGSSRYESNDDLKEWYRKLGLDGLEVMLSNLPLQHPSVIAPSDAIGVHLRYFHEWMSVWGGQEEAILEEYGDLESAQAILGGASRSEIVSSFQDNIARARALEPEYFVFHASNCSIRQVGGAPALYSDWQVVESAAELANEIFAQESPKEAVLFENLWWSGLTLLDPGVTYRLLDKAAMPNKGVMLDIGHLLHTNDSLENMRQAGEYILRVLDRYDSLDFIKGMHLHASLTGPFKRENQPKISYTGNYLEDISNLYMYVYGIDTHRPFESGLAKEIVERVNPDYLNMEFVTNDRNEHERFIQRQKLSLGL